MYIATYSPSRTASSEGACTAADVASMVGSPRSIRRLFTMSSVFSYSRVLGVSEDDSFDMSVEELASKLEFGVQPPLEQAAAEVQEVMEVH